MLNTNSRPTTLAAAILLAASLSAQVPASHGIAVSSMDPSVRPGDSFYLYTNGA